jgi:hypothetical protein
MMARILTSLSVLAVALLLGAGSAWWMVMHPPSSHGIAIGPWRTSTDVGSENAGMYLRANIAVTGLFALNKSEAVYFFAATDDSGQPLRAKCTYAVEGKPVAARWWSITAYADDNFLIPNSANRFSFNMGNLETGAEGTFKLITGPTEQTGHWLPTRSGAGGFNLTFRIYNPSPDVLANLSTIVLPSIKRVGGCA